MSNYSKPLVIENNEMFEGVFALESGVLPGYTADIVWTNQNSGSHSDLKCWVKLAEGVTSEYIKITCTFVGLGGIIKFGDSSAGDKVSYSGKTVTYIENQHRNSGETIEFSFNNVVFSNGEITPGHDKGAYYQSGTHMYESALADGTWVIDVTIS